MSARAWLYIAAVLAAGVAISILAAPGLAQPPAVWATWTVLTAGTTLALLFRAVFTAKHGSDDGTTAYSPVLVFLLAGALLLPPAPMILLIVVSHVIQWAKERWAKSANLPAWYIQPFNMAVYMIAGRGVQQLGGLLNLGSGAFDFSPQPLLIALLIALSYLLLNSLLVGQALVLGRGVSWRATGIFAPENLAADLVLLALGYAVARLWADSPWLIPLALAPLLLVSRALMVPQLKKEAQTDEKTGLTNARHFGKLFTAELERATRFDRPLAVFMADLDFLRDINNVYGHLAGDAVLAGLGRIIRETIPDYDVAARFGGEEFIILLPEAGKGEALALAERLRQTVAATPFAVYSSAAPVHVTVSIGIACFPQDGQTETALIHAADMAVYQAKLAGRDRTVCAADMPHSAQFAVAPREPILAASRPALPAEPRLQPTPAPVLPPATAPKPAERGLRLFVGGVIAAGTLVAGLGFTQEPRLDFLALGLLVLLAACFESFQISIYGPATASVTSAIAFTAAAICGLPGVALVALAIALAHYVRRRPPVYKTAFNWATYVLAGAAVVVILRPLALPLVVANLPGLVLPAILAALAQYSLNTGLVAAAISLSTGAPLTSTWRREFQWLAGHYLVLGMLGLLLGVAYTTLGLVGALVFVVPIVMMRYVQQQYVERTRHSVRELTRMNEELARANAEIVAAGTAAGRLNDELFSTLARILDARDPYVAGHAVQVATYAVATASALGIRGERLQTIWQAGLLHDIGKIAIAEHILHKPGALTPAEYEHVKTHVTIGADFLRSSQALQHLAPYVRSHHEHWDGKGYPDGLRGDEIPLEARILAVCDAVEAMASDRPYQRGKSAREVIAELRRCAGNHFDPAVSAAFVSIIEREGDGVVVNSARDVVLRHAEGAEAAGHADWFADAAPEGRAALSMPLDQLGNVWA